MPATMCKADNAEQAHDVAERATAVLDAGGLVVIPTETVYGVAASAGSAAGVAALREFKQRPDTPITVHLPDPAAAELYVDTASPALSRLIRKLMPGPVTFVVEVSDDVQAARLSALGLPVEVAPHIYHRNTIGLRCPDHHVGRRVLAAASNPVVASSANRRGAKAPVEAQEAAAAVGDAAELIVDGGRCRFAKASTIVRVSTVEGPLNVSVVRAGVYDERYVRKLMRWTMLLVCSGNTCRSPMAEGLAKSMLATQRGLAADELESAGIRVLSAGTFAAPGSGATPEAVEAMRKLDIDISDHLSRPLTPQLIQEADVIYCMTETHHQSVLQMVPGAAAFTHLLDASGDIDDPIGSGTTGYQRSAELIRRRLASRLKEQQS